MDRSDMDSKEGVVVERWRLLSKVIILNFSSNISKGIIGPLLENLDDLVEPFKTLPAHRSRELGFGDLYRSLSFGI